MKFGKYDQKGYWKMLCKFHCLNSNISLQVAFWFWACNFLNEQNARQTKTMIFFNWSILIVLDYYLVKFSDIPYYERKNISLTLLAPKLSKLAKKLAKSGKILQYYPKMMMINTLWSKNRPNFLKYYLKCRQKMFATPTYFGFVLENHYI